MSSLSVLTELINIFEKHTNEMAAENQADSGIESQLKELVKDIKLKNVIRFPFTRSALAFESDGESMFEATVNVYTLPAHDSYDIVTVQQQTDAICNSIRSAVTDDEALSDACCSLIAQYAVDKAAILHSNASIFVAEIIPFIQKHQASVEKKEYPFDGGQREEAIYTFPQCVLYGRMTSWFAQERQDRFVKDVMHKIRQHNEEYLDADQKVPHDQYDRREEVLPLTVDNFFRVFFPVNTETDGYRKKVLPTIQKVVELMNERLIHPMIVSYLEYGHNDNCEDFWILAGLLPSKELVCVVIHFEDWI